MMKVKPFIVTLGSLCALRFNTHEIINNSCLKNYVSYFGKTWPILSCYLLLFQSLQDLGNVNVSFFTPRELYNRKENLALIVKVLQERWKLDVEASPRDDILVDGKFKISFYLSYSHSVTC